MAKHHPTPWNPRGLTLLFERRQTVVIAYPGATVITLMTANASRIAFYVFFDSVGIEQIVRTDAAGSAWGVSPLNGQTHVSITSHDYPVLCQQEWYYGSAIAGAATIRIVEVTRK